MKTLLKTIQILSILIGVSFSSVALAQSVNTTVEELKEKAELGHAESQYELGRMYSGLHWNGFWGYEDNKDFNEATKWFIKAAEAGHVESQYVLGLLFFMSRNVVLSDAESLRWLHKAVENDHVEAKILLGILYYDGRSVKQDYAKARKLMTDAVNRLPYMVTEDSGGVPLIYPYMVMAVTRLANIYFMGHGVKRDSIEALRWISRIESHESIPDRLRIIESVTRAAKRGDKKAQQSLATVYYNSIQCEGGSCTLLPDAFNNAIKWYTALARQGDIEAQRRLVEFYYHYSPCEENNWKKGLYWYRIIAEKGNSEDQLGFGRTFHDLRCPDDNVDIKEAVRWYRKAAEQGNVEAQYELGFLYASGREIENNDNMEALKWYSKAAEQAHAGAQNQLTKFSRYNDHNFYALISADYNYAIYYNQNAPIEDLTGIEDFRTWKFLTTEQGRAEAQKYVEIRYDNPLPEFVLRLCNAETRNAVEAKTVGDQEAMRLCSAARQGNAEAQYFLGRVFCRDCYGNDSFYYSKYPSDYDKVEADIEAAKFFALAARQGHPDAQFRLASMLFEGRGIKTNDDDALRWAKLAVDQNVIDAKVLLGHLYYEGRGVKQDYSKAAELYHEALKQNGKDWVGGDLRHTCGRGPTRYGGLYMYNCIPYTEAKIRLGNMYYYGQGVKQDFVEAFKWYYMSLSPEYRPKNGFEYDDNESRIALRNFPIALRHNHTAAEEGNVAAQLLIFHTGFYGSGGEQEAIDWVRKAAEQGNAEAQLAQRGKHWYEWLEKSANQGNMYAQNYLADYFNAAHRDAQDSLIQKQKLTQAIKWYALAAKNGYINAWISLKRFAIVEEVPEAQFALGQLFAEGCLGVKKNEVNALKLFQMAAKQGYEPARQAIENMKQGKQPRM